MATGRVLISYTAINYMVRDQSQLLEWVQDLVKDYVHEDVIKHEVINIRRLY